MPRVFDPRENNLAKALLTKIRTADIYHLALLTTFIFPQKTQI